MVARAAVDSGAGFPAEIALSRAMIGLRRPEEAQAVLEAGRPVGAVQAAELALTSAQNLHDGLGRPDRALEVLSEALARLPEDAVSELIVARALCELSAGRLGTAESLSTAVIENAGVPLAAQIGAIG